MNKSTENQFGIDVLVINESIDCSNNDVLKLSDQQINEFNERLSDKTNEQVEKFIIRCFEKYTYDSKTRNEKLANFSAKNNLSIEQYEMIQNAMTGRL